MALILSKGELDAIRPPSVRGDDGRMDSLDTECGAFIARAPFACLSTTDGRGGHHLAPLGGRPGFVEVLDERTLLLPEWPAPEDHERLKELLDDGRTGVLFLVPGEARALEVAGSASLSNDPRFLNHFRSGDEVPEVVILLEVTAAAFVGSMAIRRAALWSPASPSAS